jgi:hypothetical protein
MGYSNRLRYLAPYKGERYHLPEWHRGMEPNSPKEKFNRVHSSIRNIVKNKWQILYKMHKYSMLTQKRLLLPLWSSATTFVSIQVVMWILLIVIEIPTLCLLSRIDTTSMQRYLMLLMMQLPKQVFLRWMHFVIVWQHPFQLRGVE